VFDFEIIVQHPVNQMQTADIAIVDACLPFPGNFQPDDARKLLRPCF